PGEPPRPLLRRPRRVGGRAGRRGAPALATPARADAGGRAAARRPAAPARRPGSALTPRGAATLSLATLGQSCKVRAGPQCRKAIKRSVIGIVDPKHRQGADFARFRSHRGRLDVRRLATLILAAAGLALAAGSAAADGMTVRIATEGAFPPFNF